MLTLPAQLSSSAIWRQTLIPPVIDMTPISGMRRSVNQSFYYKLNFSYPDRTANELKTPATLESPQGANV